MTRPGRDSVERGEGWLIDISSTSKRPTEHFTCEVCGTKVTTNKWIRIKSKSCSRKCCEERIRIRAKEWGTQYYRRLKTLVPVSSVTLGAIGELMVCADLVAQGFLVFKAVTPTGSFDVYAFRDGRDFRIEVRTGGYLNDGKNVTYCKGRLATTPWITTVAIVLPDKIIYMPELPLPNESTNENTVRESTVLPRSDTLQRVPPRN